ncbi:MAG: hypothetical protein IT423_19575 [Pirellulaceae bacterium]|nr:hypothetical protein [Pirellulaceae bacterium]
MFLALGPSRKLLALACCAAVLLNQLSRAQTAASNSSAAASANAPTTPAAKKAAATLPVVTSGKPTSTGTPATNSLASKTASSPPTGQKTEITKTEPAKTGPAKSNAAKTESTKTSPAKTESSGKPEVLAANSKTSRPATLELSSSRGEVAQSGDTPAKLAPAQSALPLSSMEVTPPATAQSNPQAAGSSGQLTIVEPDGWTVDQFAMTVPATMSSSNTTSNTASKPSNQPPASNQVTSNQAPGNQVTSQSASAAGSSSTNVSLATLAGQRLPSEQAPPPPVAAATASTAVGSKSSLLSNSNVPSKSSVLPASATQDLPPPPPSSSLSPGPSPSTSPSSSLPRSTVFPATAAPVTRSAIGTPPRTTTHQLAPKPTLPQKSSSTSTPASTAPKSEPTFMRISDQPGVNLNSNSTSNSTSNLIGSRTNNQAASPIVGSAALAEGVPAIGHQILESIQFEDVPLSEAMKLFAEQSGLNVITSAEAGKTQITVYLKNVTALDALDAIVKANGLFYRIETSSGIVRIATSKEYEKDLSSFREEQTRVFTLLYPNPIAVAQVIQQVFGNRVQMNRADADLDDLIDLSQRFSRFDLVDGRSLGLGAPNLGNSANNQGGMGQGGGIGGLGGGGMGGGLGAGLGGMAGLGGAQGMGQNQGGGQARSNALGAARHREHLAMNDLAAEEIQKIENEVARQGQLNADAQADLLQRRDATIYISTIRRNNQVIVRTGDQRSMEQIAQLIHQLDVPTPTVLLEVKVLRIVLANGFNSAFEYFGASGNASTAMSDGTLAPAFPGASAVSRGLGAGLGVAGGVPGSLTFQMVDDKFRVRMQLLESKNCVTALATPLILTANNEVSRIFVGDTLPFTVGFTPSQVLSSVSAVNGAVAATPITELRDVGQSLLITPNINADRTVTLRVIEENSERVLSGSSIPVPATSGTGVTNVNVDTVRRRTISGTIVAQDGMAVALGGLIEEQVSDARDQVPVLGNIPGLGLLFRRQATGRSRSELVVIVRPYVFNTPTESAATSEMLLGQLSTHPNSPGVSGTLTNALPCRVTRSDAESSERAKLFQLHHRSLTAY